MEEILLEGQKGQQAWRFKSEEDRLSLQRGKGMRMSTARKKNHQKIPPSLG